MIINNVISDEEIEAAISRVLLTEGILDIGMLSELVMQEIKLRGTAVKARISELALDRIVHSYRTPCHQQFSLPSSNG